MTNKNITQDNFILDILDKELSIEELKNIKGGHESHDIAYSAGVYNEDEDDVPDM